MGKAVVAREIMRRICVVAVAATVAVAIAFGAAGSESATQAYAAEANWLQTAQTASGHCLKTTAVKKKYPSKQKMTMTMAGGDVTTIGARSAGTKVKWSSSNKKIARVKSTGKRTAKVTALKPGKATVTAKSGSQTLVCKVVVTGALNKRSITMTPLQTSKIRLKGATAKKWKSSSKDVVTVSKKGVLTPKATGTATITCTDKKGYKYKCAVTVKCPDITCMMSATAIGMAKSFTLTNKCGKSVVLDCELVSYYPNGFDSTPYSLHGFTDLSSSKTFGDGAIAVADNASYSFYGLDDDVSTVTQSGVFGLRFSIDAVKYCATFRTDGAMIACGRA